ncbi:MAG TPA: outer membrane beta-barrel protein [Rhizomicrobium sp.]|nr:outer membrane beta-barrel protein [Rhizomicrobium sp.]
MRIAAAALAALLGLCMAGSAEAQTRLSDSSQTYGFVYGEFSHFDATGLKVDGGGGGAGWHFTRYLGIQGGVDYYRQTPLDLTTANAEVMLTYPANDKFSLYAGLGGSYAHGTANPGLGSITRESTGYSVSMGMEYWFRRPFGLRFGYHHQNAGGVADQLGIGLALRF